MDAWVSRYLIAAVLLGAAATSEKPAIVVQAPDSPVRLDKAVVLSTADAPPLILYSATNIGSDNLEQFTVMAFVFDAEGTLKARQVAPARRTLETHTTKFSTLVLDGSEIQPNYQIVIGVNQAQKVGSETWWRAELQEAAAAAVKHPKH